AAAYACVAYQTAYLRCHYPKAFLAALFSSVIDHSGKVAEYAAVCAKLQIRLLPPHVNFAVEKFTVEPDGIRLGMLAIRNMGQGFIRGIVAERAQNGSFESFHSFLKRMQGKDFNRRAAEALIQAGALDGLGANRREMMMALPLFLNGLEDDARRNIEGQIGFFELPGQKQSGEPALPPQAEFSHADLLAGEKETMGFYLSGHPLMRLQNLAQRLGSAKTVDLLDPANETGQGRFGDNEETTLLCVITGAKKKVVKNNQTMAFLTVEDMYGQMEVLVFPGTLERFANLCMEGRTVLLSGRLCLQENKEAKLLCNTLEEVSETMAEQDRLAPHGARKTNAAASAKKPARPGAFLRFASAEDPRLPKARHLLAIFAEGGTTPVRFFYEDEKRYEPQPSAAWNPVLARELCRLLGEENVVSNA
ncbi:MAG: DNA polymerase III subunit alpha, partial [Oscillospiraceae bacterium]|nr:DNA polymerase III subunit alpha [Oscillospiraceae bacterium]